MQGLACALVAGLVATAANGSFLHFDLNGVGARAGEAFDGATHTGVIELFMPLGAHLNTLERDGVSLATTGSLASLSGEIRLTAGVVTGGFVEFAMDLGEAYAATIVDGSGAVNTQAGAGFRIDGLTEGGGFAGLIGGETFAGATVMDPSKSGTTLPMDGSFLLHGFGPDASGWDGLVDLDIYAQAIVPAPGAGALALFGLALGNRRKR
jgi:hypothetical protein